MDHRSALGCIVGAASLAAAGFGVSPRPALAAAASPGKIEDIVVTAQRREQKSQSVPIVITTFSPKRLEQQNIKTASDLEGTVSSLTVGANGQGSRETQAFTLRGQGSTFQASPGVVVYLNEVPLPAPISLSQQGGPGNFIDLQNLQVLAGPQGTLFGRNTTGGAVLLVPKKPTNGYSGYIESKFSNYHGQYYEGALNIPVIPDTLLVRVAGATNARDGYTRNVSFNSSLDNVHYSTGRVGVTWRPIEGLENYTMGYATYSSNNGTGIINEGFNIQGLQGVGFCVNPPLTPPGPSGIAAPCSVYTNATQRAQDLGPRATALGTNPFQVTQTFGVTNTTRYAINDQLAVRNIFSFQTFTSRYSYDGDGTVLQQNEEEPIRVLPGYQNATKIDVPRDDIQDVTEELQAQGNAFDRKLIYTVGAFYYDQKPRGTQGATSLDYCPALFSGFCAANPSFYSVENKSEAAYAQATLNLGLLTPALNKFKLTGGYRYTFDQIDGTETTYSPQANGTVICNNNNQVAASPSDCTYSGNLRSSAPSWLVDLDYNVTDKVLIYAKVSHSYKAGGFNTFSVRPTTATFSPETVTSYEGGFKSDFTVASLPARLNADYYYLTYGNIQRASGDFNSTTSASGAQVLGAAAHIQGVELEAALRPVPPLEIGGNFSYIDAKYTKFEYTAEAPTEACNGAVPTGGKADASCVPFQYVSPITYSVHASLDLPIPPHMGSLAVFANYSFISAQNTEAVQLSKNQPFERLPSYSLVSASLDWNNIAERHVDLGIYATNLTNSTYRISNSDVFQSGSLLYASTIYGEPRMYGVQLRYHFGS